MLHAACLQTCCTYSLQSTRRVHCSDETIHCGAQLWAVRIEAAQAPLLMSSRDGRLLRPVPVEARLAPGALREALTLAAGGRLAADARSLLCGAWQRGAPPMGSLSCHLARSLPRWS